MNLEINSNKDFLYDHYKEILKLAKSKFTFITYEEIHGNDNFMLWRHDVDFSLERALALAEIEHSMGIKSTYFINPHSEFYNPLEKNQREIIFKISNLGHKIGLHFDCIYYDVTSELMLESLIKKEVEFLSLQFSKEIKVFSFHNPTPEVLKFEKNSYGGLINCYSKWFKESVTYCSDSNGYWRHERIFDLLARSTSGRFQILTHPDWWTSEILFPRERIFKSIYDKAQSSMKFYDDAVKSFGRENVKGYSSYLDVFKKNPREHFICDLLWNLGAFELLNYQLGGAENSKNDREECILKMKKLAGEKE